MNKLFLEPSCRYLDAWAFQEGHLGSRLLQHVLQVIDSYIRHHNTSFRHFNNRST